MLENVCCVAQLDLLVPTSEEDDKLQTRSTVVNTLAKSEREYIAILDAIVQVSGAERN